MLSTEFKAHKAVDQLRKGVKVYNTGEMKMTYVLTLNNQKFEKIMDEVCTVIYSQEQDQIIIYKKTCLNVTDPEVIDKLASYLKIDFSKLLVLLMCPGENLGKYLRSLGIQDARKDYEDLEIDDDDFKWMISSKDGGTSNSSRMVSSISTPSIRSSSDRKKFDDTDLNLEAMESIGGSPLATYIQNPLWQKSVDEHISRVSKAALDTIDRPTEITLFEEDPVIDFVNFTLADDKYEEPILFGITEDSDTSTSDSASVITDNTNTVSRLSASKSRVQFFDSTESTELIGFLGELYVC